MLLSKNKHCHFHPQTATFEHIEICLLLILLDMTKIEEGVGELIGDVTLGDGVGLKNFLRPECVRVSLTNLK